MKETLNTFSEGLVKDYNEMVSPKNVMSNCLNGTLITYNGNEFTLQNDMGNAKLENVKLPAGYVPVGTTEYGGIVYVASFNPVTGKGQIGSYPSPRQIWEDDQAYNDNATIKYTEFIDTDELSVDGETIRVPIITTDIIKKYLFRDNGVSRHFSVGDLWNVNTKKFPQWLTDLLDNNLAKIEFSVINDSGQTETIDKLSYTNLAREAREGIQINSDNQWQVLNTQSNGILQMALKLNTFQTFNLYRTYNIDSNGNIESVTFTGKADNEDVELYYQGVGKSITIQPENGLVKYNIMPVCKAGAVKRLERTGVIDINKLQRQKSAFYNFHFYVGDYNTTIYWSYDYIDINNKSITKMVVSYQQLRASGYYGSVSIPLSESSYIGDFQLVLGSLKIGGIYELTFTIYKDDNSSKVIETKYIYNVPLFNNWPTENFDIKERPTIYIHPTYDSKTSIESANVSYKRNNNWIPDSRLVDINPQYSSYIIQKPSTEHSFLTVKEGTYTIQPNIDLSVSEVEFGGETYKTTQIGTDFTNLDYSIQSNVGLSETPTYNTPLNKDKLVEDSTASVSNNTIKVTTYRSIYAPQSTPYEKTLYVEQLMPVYDNDSDKLFSFKEEQGTLSYIAAGKKEQINHSAIVNYGNTVNQSDGINTGNGGDEAGLQSAMIAMGDQSFGIMAGFGGQKASLRIENYKIDYNNSQLDGQVSAWYQSGQEIDKRDNFLVATCKDTNGQHFLLNLASRKNESTYGRRYVTYNLRCILSQLLIAKRKKVQEFITAPDKSKVVYHTDYTTDVNIRYSIDSQFSVQAAGEDYEAIISRYNLSNTYFPIYKLQDSTIEETVTVGKELGVETDLLEYYSISLPSASISYENYKTQIDNMNLTPLRYQYNTGDVIDANHLRSFIFIGEVNSIDVTTGVCELATYDDGSYKVKQIAGVNKDAIWSNTTYTLDSQPITLKYWDSFTKSTSTTDIYVGNLNKLFTTSINFEGRQGSNIGEDYYNTLLLRPVSGSTNGRINGRWVEGSDKHAPDMIIGYFGPLSLYRLKEENIEL